MPPTFIQVLIGMLGSFVGTVLVTFFLLGQLPALVRFGRYPLIGAVALLAVVLVGRILEGIEAASSG